MNNSECLSSVTRPTDATTHIRHVASRYAAWARAVAQIAERVEAGSVSTAAALRVLGEDLPCHEAAEAQRLSDTTCPLMCGVRLTAEQDRERWKLRDDIFAMLQEKP
jgi:hypothetical protein